MMTMPALILLFAPSVEVLVVGVILCGYARCLFFLLPAAMGGILLRSANGGMRPI